MEKTHQVRLMGSIYRKALQCLVWLGDLRSLAIGESQSEAIVEIINMLASTKHLSKLPCFLGTSASAYMGAFKGLLLLLESSWWCRMWTVQEVVLPQASTIVWGKMSIDWESFQSAALWLLHHENGCCHEIASKFSEELSYICDRFTCHVTAIYFMRQDPAMQPINCLWRFRTREATDPRDKVLGLLGLLPH
jgi:Heterokaryon incompatibility protein (HET)